MKKFVVALVAFVGMSTAQLYQQAQAQGGTISDPLSMPSPNAALQYQRALLLLADMDERDGVLLEKPIWKTLPSNALEQFPSATKRMLYRTRLAADAAARGSRMHVCDFGIDFRVSGAATALPHVRPTVRLGRLLTLRGAYAQSQGNWNEAALIYFDGIRMGRHMAHQPTLIEAIAGMQIMQNNFYALANWACQCPKPRRVARVFGLFETIADDLVRPAQTLISEASVLALDFENIAKSYPDGPWGTVILQSLGEQPGEKEEDNRIRAIATCAEAGIPKKIFSDDAAFSRYIQMRRRLDLQFTEAAAACMRLPVKSRIARGERLYKQYRKAIGVLGDQNLLNPAEIGAMFASHEAETTLLRVALALAAKKDEDGFPTSLDAIASGFGGEAPTSPYDGTPLTYKLLDDGESFQLSIARTRIGSQTLPRVVFNSGVPTAAPQDSRPETANEKE